MHNKATQCPFKDTLYAKGYNIALLHNYYMQSDINLYS